MSEPAPHPMTAPLRLAALGHTGSVIASGMRFDASLLTEPEIRARVLALYAPGDQSFRTQNALALLFAQPRRVRCADSPGAVLVQYGKVHSPAPLTPAELAALTALAPTQVALVQLHAGEASLLHLSDAAREDPATWLDASAFAVYTSAASLGAPEDVSWGSAQ